MKLLIILVLSILVVKCITSIIANKMDRENLQYIKNLRDKVELFKKSMNFIEQELRLHNLKECPFEEKDQIVKDIIDFIEGIKVYW